LLTTLLLGALVYWLLLLDSLPFYALPLLWVTLGALYAGLSAIVHDCAQDTFSASRVVNRLVGTVAALPLLIPFTPVVASTSTSWLASLARGRAWLLASGAEWVRANFSLSAAWVPGQRRLLVVALVLQWAVAYTVVRTWGAFALFKYWLMPWCAYLVWRSVFLHGVYRVPFTDTEVRVDVQFAKYPMWLRLLTNDVATVLTASRLFSHYVGVPNAHVRAAISYLFFSTDDAIAEEREKRRLIEEQEQCSRLEKALDFGVPLNNLPLITREKFRSQGRAAGWVLCDNLVFDVSTFTKSHPGGESLLKQFYGNDITKVFNGAVYNHSNGARNLSRHFMIARIAAEDTSAALPEIQAQENS